MKILEELFAELYAKTVSQHEQWAVNQRFKDQLKQRVENVLGDFSHLDGKYTKELLETVHYDDYIREHYHYKIGTYLQFSMYILTPKTEIEKYPAVLALHGHGYGNKSIVGLKEDGSNDNEWTDIHGHFAVELVRRGLKVFAPEMIGFGERLFEKDRVIGLECSCTSLANQLLLYGKTLAGLRVFEAIKVVDIMEQFSDVNGKIGIMGFSGGGLVAAYVSALDERIQAAVLTGFPSTFKGSIIPINHCIDNYLPRILNIAELPHIIGLLAPRPLFIESATDDEWFPLDSVQAAIAELEKIYHMENARNIFTYDLFEGKHSVSGRKSYDWLVKQLIDSGKVGKK